MTSHGKRTFFPIAMMPKQVKSNTSFITPDAKIKGKPSQTVMKSTMSISEMLAAVMEKKNFDMNSPAIFHDRKMKLTFRGLDDISTRLAQNLAKAMRNAEGLKPNGDGDTVIAFLLNDDEIDEKVITLIIAIMKLGVTYIALDPSASPNDLLWTLNTVKPAMIITGSIDNNQIQEALVKIDSSTDIPMVLMTALWTNARVDNISLDKSIPLLDLSDPEYWSDLPLNERTVAIFFTAGSIGSPHGVRIGARQVYNRIHWQSKVFPLVNSDVHCLTSVLSDPRSLAQIFIPLLAGKPLTILNKNDLINPSRLVERIAESKLTRISLTPPEFAMVINEMAKTPKYKNMVSTMTHWTVSGGSFNMNVARKFFKEFSGAYKSGVFLISTYGTAEVLGEATYEVFFNAEDLNEKISSGTGATSVGVPISNTSVTIVDDNEKSLPMGQRGEVVFSGACLFAGGYVGQGSGTRAKFNVNHMLPTSSDKVHLQFRTGDVGRIVLDKGGVRRLYIDGRVDTQVKVAGQIINLSNLSGCIMSTGLVQDTHVLTYHRGRESQVIIAACVLKNGGTVSKIKTKLREAVSQPNTLVPEIFSVEKLPLLPNGRVDKKELRALYRDCLLNCNGLEWKSLTSVSRKLSTVKVFCRAVALSLGIPLPQVIANFNSNYWDMGGSALNAVMTVKICADNGLSIAVEDFVTAETLKQIVDRIDLSGEKLKPDAWLLDTDFIGQFSYDLMTPNDEDDVVRILKDDCIPAGMSYSVDVIKYWKALIDNVRQNNLCVVAKGPGNKVVGVAINGEAEAKMKFPKTPKEIIYGLELLGACQEASRSQMWRKSKGRVAQTFFLAIKDNALSIGDAIIVTQQLLIRTCLAAQSSRYSGVLLATANPLVQETCTNLLKFENLLEFPVSRFKAKDKTRPFTNADDHHTASVLFKDISWESQQDGSGTVSRIASLPSMTSPASNFKL